ncbi:MAG: FmdB family transcriptional regulator [Phycisphaerales bacterium]|nr:FmdB family transcriptional regulator [Phycisphaerales bacterium]
MPTYLYCVVTPDGADAEQFEVFQSIHEPALSKHPETGLPVRRLPVASQMQLGSDGQRLSNKNLDRLGFTKYERAGDGVWEKKAGHGPPSIKRDDD